MREAIEENRSLISRFTFCPECRADQLSPKRRVCRSFELQCKSVELHCNSIELHCKSFERHCKFLNLDATVVFHLLAFVFCLLFTFFSAEAVLGTTEAVSTKLLAEAVQGTVVRGFSSVCRSRPTILQKLCIGFVGV